MSLNTNFVLSFFGLIIFSGFLAGSYPAAYLSGLNPITVLKGRLSSSVGEFWARKGLVVFQFVISITLIVAVLVIFKQVEFVQTKNIGYDKDNLISFDMEGRVAESPEVFLSGIKRLPGIVNASSIGSRLIGSYGSTSGLDWEGKRPEERILFETIQVNYDMIETLGIEMTAGRTFSRDFSSDRSRLIFNEAAIQAMGLENPVGKIIKFWGNDAEILGICKDFHIESLHEKVKPLFFRLLPEHTSYIIAKIEAGKERGTINKLRAFYKTFNPGFILDYKFMDEAYQALYESEKRVAGLSGYFAGLAIFISCLGLFGLSAFTAERRVKEIGIRKVLGSSSFAIVRLISADFTKMVLLAIVIALPASYFIAQNWLLSFAYRIELEPWYFAAAGLLALLTALVTVGTQAIRGATVNPVQCLRDE